MVLLTAAQALDSSTTPGVVEALGAAFARVTAERRETSRDPRIAMLESIEHIGSAPLATQLRDAAKDFDSTVAQTAARLATQWTANKIQPEPVPLPLAPVPSLADMAAWARLTAVFTMRTGGVVRVRLRPFDAPTNVSRFVRMARSGWFNGLTFHRVVPNFVVQGGSPGANEYMGDGPFTRDELGLEHHFRGTVGISTRGRDTGDGQLFLNLIDNWRLDHDYTIIGEIIAGMNVVDAMQEGVTIQRVDLVEEKP
jgi:cyclophilin family peptidyl-prolyl cis-trans isomerase